MITIDRWIDVDSEEYKELCKELGGALILKIGLRSKALMTDKEGRVYSNPIDPNAEKMPLNDKWRGQTVGFRIPAMAAN